METQRETKSFSFERCQKRTDHASARRRQTLKTSSSKQTGLGIGHEAQNAQSSVPAQARLLAASHGLASSAFEKTASAGRFTPESGSNGDSSDGWFSIRGVNKSTI